jgi:hypothetical protein
MTRRGRNEIKISGPTPTREEEESEVEEDPEEIRAAKARK